MVQHNHLDRFARLESELTASQSKVNELTLLVTEATLKHKKTLAELNQSRSQEEKLQDELNACQQSLSDNIRSLNIVTATLEERHLTTSQLIADHETEVHQIQQRLEDAYAKLILINRAYQMRVNDSNRYEMNSAVSRKEIQRLEKEILAIRQTHTTLVESHADLEDRHQRRENELATVRMANDALSSECQQLRSDMSELQFEQAEMCRRCESLESRLNDVTASFDTLSHTHADLESRHRQLETQLSDAESQLHQHHQLAAMIHKLSGQVKTK